MNFSATANGVPLIEAEIVRPRIGNWHADLTVDATEIDHFTGAVEIELQETLRLKGWAFRKGLHHSTVFVRVIGGAGGLGKEIPPQAYSNVPVRIPLSDCLALAGETLSPLADTAALNVFLPKWARLRQGAGTELGALVKASGAAAWRVLSDGTIWLGPELWPASAMVFDEVEVEPELGRLTFISDAPAIDPGQTLTAPGESYDGARVSLLRHLCDRKGVRHWATFEDTSRFVSADRGKAGIEAYLRATIQPQIDRSACYWAKVVSQNVDGTLELKPDSAKIPFLSHVPITPGIADTTVKVSAGARALIQFADGDATKPIVTGWGTATATEINLGAGSEFVALSNLVNQRLADLKSAISGAGVTAGDGGATFKANILAALAAISATWPDSTAATVVKAK